MFKIYLKKYMYYLKKFCKYLKKRKREMWCIFIKSKFEIVFKYVLYFCYIRIFYIFLREDGGVCFFLVVFEWLVGVGGVVEYFGGLFDRVC